MPLQAFLPAIEPSSVSRSVGLRAASLRVFARALCGAVLLVVGGNALSLPERRAVGHYDFGYAIRGDVPARPAQVFDDGAGKVYFQPRPGRPMPAVFAGQDPQLLILQPEGQYFTARTGASEFTLALGAARASVRRGDAALGAETLTPARVDAGRLLASAGPGLPEGVDISGDAEASAADSEPDPQAFRTLSTSWAARRIVHTQPVVFAPGSGVLRTEVREALSALVVRIGRGTAIVVEGRNDPGRHAELARLRAEALRNALLARGVASADIEMRVDERESTSDGAAPSGAPSATSSASTIRWTTTRPLADSARPLPADAPSAFDIDLTDRDVAASLRRWAGASGYELVWDVPWPIPVDGTLRLEASSFLDAARQVATGLRARGYPVQARAYADHVVRFAAAR